MKTPLRNLIAALPLLLCNALAAERGIGEFPTYTAGSITTATDRLLFVDPEASDPKGRAVTIAEMWKALGGTNVNATELGYLGNVTSDIQTQIDGKQASIGNGTLPLNKLSQSSATTNQVIKWNGSAWAAADASGTVDNATVNTAIGTNTYATNLVLGTPLNNNLGLSASAFRDGDPDFHIWQIGDSLSNNPIVNLGSTLGENGGYLPSSSSIDGGTGTPSSITTQGNDEWQWTGGRAASLPVGSARIYGEDYVSTAAYPLKVCTSIRIWYVRGVGRMRVQASLGTGATFTDITTTPNNHYSATANHTAIDTNTGTAGELAFHTITFTRGDYRRFKIFSDAGSSPNGGTIKILGIEGFSSSSRPGYRISRLNIGGSYDYNWNLLNSNGSPITNRAALLATQEASWRASIAASRPNMIVFRAASFHTRTAGAWQAVIGRIRTAAIAATGAEIPIYMIGTTPWDEPVNTPSVIESPDPLVDESGFDGEMKTYALANAPHVTFLDIRRFWPAYSKMATKVRLSADHTTDTFTSAPHTWSTGDATQVSTSGGTLPSGLSAATTYYIIKLDGNTYKLAASAADATAGTAINITSNGSGFNYISTGGVGLISETDGIHLVQGIGHGYLSALVDPYFPTLFAKPFVNNAQSQVVAYNLPEATGFSRSAIGAGPRADFVGDLRHADGQIAVFDVTGQSGSLRQAFTIKSWGGEPASTNANCRLINGYSIGMSPTSYQIHASPYNNGCIMITELPSPQTTITRNANAQLEVIPPQTGTKTGIAISLYAGHTAPFLQGFTGTDLGPTSATAGTSAFQFDSTGNLKFDAVGKGVFLKRGSNNGNLAGTVTLSSGAGTITSSAIDADTVIMLSLKTSSGTPDTASPRVDVGAGSATVTGLSTDNSTYNWVAIKTQ